MPNIEQTVLITDITQVENIPLNVYLATFIRRLVAVPLGTPHPTHAICAYWREPGQIDPESVTLMEALCRALGAVRPTEFKGGCQQPAHQAPTETSQPRVLWS